MEKIFAAVSLALCIASCTKKDAIVTLPAQTQTPVKQLVEVLNVSDTTDKRSFQYDLQGRLTMSETYTHKWLVEYQPSKVIITAKYKATDAILSISESLLDGAGRIISVISRNANNEINYTQTFEYDANGYVIKEKAVWTDGNVNESLYTIAGGNAIRQEYYKNGSLYDQTDYEYETSVPSKTYHNFQASWPMNNLYGKSYSNELKRIKRYNHAGILIFEKQSTYTTNPEGYVTARKDYYPISNLTREYQLKYN